MSEQHFFDIEIAKKYGVNEAIIYTNLLFWIKKNKANGKHYYDGRYWSYNSVKAFQVLFPYLSIKQIRTALENLINNNVLIKGNYNSNPYDRTLWYAFKEEPEELKTINGQIDDNIKENGFDKKESSILPERQIEKPKTENHYTDINTYINPNLNTDMGEPQNDSVYDDTTGYYKNPPPSDYKDFEILFINAFNELTVNTATELYQVYNFRNQQNRDKLLEVFNNRKYDYKKCINKAMLEAKKSPPNKSWLDFQSFIKVYLLNGFEGIKEPPKSNNTLEDIERREAEAKARQTELDKIEAKKLGLSLEEYYYKLENEGRTMLENFKRTFGEF